MPSWQTTCTLKTSYKVFHAVLLISQIALSLHTDTGLNLHVPIAVVACTIPMVVSSAIKAFYTTWYVQERRRRRRRRGEGEGEGKRVLAFYPSWAVKLPISAMYQSVYARSGVHTTTIIKAGVVNIRIRGNNPATAPSKGFYVFGFLHPPPSRCPLTIVLSLRN